MDRWEKRIFLFFLSFLSLLERGFLRPKRSDVWRFQISKISAKKKKNRRKYDGAVGGDILTKTREGSSASNLQRRTNRSWKAIVNEFDGRWEVINDDTDVISRN